MTRAEVGKDPDAVPRIEHASPELERWMETEFGDLIERIHNLDVGEPPPGWQSRADERCRRRRLRRRIAAWVALYAVGIVALVWSILRWWRHA